MTDDVEKNLPVYLAATLDLQADLSARRRAQLFTITASAFLTTMTSDEQFGYLSGAVETAMDLAITSGEKARADRMRSWFYENADSALTIRMTFQAYPDRPAAALLGTLIDAACAE